MSPEANCPEALCYDEILAHYCDHRNATALLRRYRPYLEMIPSMRRSEESLITIPLPIIQVRRPDSQGYGGPIEKICLPCDLVILMCDPEWQIKTDVEIFIFICQAEEDFSQVLRRWRQTQILLAHSYSWEMPLHKQHIFSEGAEKTLPLFVLPTTVPERVRKGLRSAGLPFVLEPEAENGHLSEPQVNLVEVAQVDPSRSADLAAAELAEIDSVLSLMDQQPGEMGELYPDLEFSDLDLSDDPDHRQPLN